METERGQLYIGREVETDQPILYDADDLTTHGVIVGMTGSGKTGLGIDLIEEALLNGISCLVIDPKGDMGNLALVFPEMAPSDFEPWMDEATAGKQGKTVAELAAETAAAWKSGLESQDIDSKRMRKLVEGSEVTIFTPGSGAGVGLDVLGSMKAPTLDWETEAEVLRDEISAFVSSLLVLAGIESDPMSGPEHILLASIVEHYWRGGRDLDLASLVSQIPRPPFPKLGVFEVDTFFPEKDRLDLALRLNGLLASPSFASWMTGRPLDIEDLIGGESPKAAIVYLAHLSDEERQFLVTLLLGKTVTWIRSQSGTGELRALIYMDEVFGFAPPTAEPPSKKPLLTILKQARAHGVGMVLSTQNPVDLDYKAMSNAGTWMVGRLQTENDKRRILEGLESATGDVDIDLLDRQISNLDKRQFVLHSTKTSEPTLFGTRWAMSYLAGPLTRDQVSRLMGERRTEEATQESPRARSETTEASPPPTPPDGVPSLFMSPVASWAATVGADSTSTLYRPAAAATVQLLYDDTSPEITHQETFEAIIFPLDGVIDASEVRNVDHETTDFVSDLPAGARYRSATDLASKTFWKGIETDLKAHLVANRPLQVWRNTSLDIYSRVGESKEEFRVRCAAAAEAAADTELAVLKDEFQKKMERIKEDMAEAQTRYHEADAVAAAKSQESLVGTAGDLLGAFLGGKSGSAALRRAARRRTATTKAEARAETEAARYHAKHQELVDLETELGNAVEEIGAKHDGQAEKIDAVEIPLEKSDVRVADLKLVWIPVPDS